jgi:probable DNA metabolism protein
MTIFRFDYTFEGLLTALFDAYFRRTFPDLLLGETESLPLFYDDLHTVVTDTAKSERVWRGLCRKLSPSAQTALMECWLAEEPETPMLLLRYMRKTIDAPGSIETNFADPDVLEFSRMWKRVDWERTRLLQFLRFQKAADGTYFAAVEPEKNALPLAVEHFRDRFSDQRWLIYDIRRAYGFYYDLQRVERVTFREDVRAGHLVTGMLSGELMADDEALFQQLWKTYFKAICIKERMNPRKQRQDMPVRYWRLLTEKQ